MRTLLLFLLWMSTLAPLSRAGTAAPGPSSTFVTTLGRPYAAWAAPDGVHVLVTETGPARDFQHSGGELGTELVGGVEIFHVAGETLRSERFVRLGPFMAQGIAPIPGTGVVAVAMTNAGVLLTDLDGLMRGEVIQSFLLMGPAPGSAVPAAMPDGRALFVANEYGANGSVGMIRLKAKDGHLASAEVAAPLPAPRAAPGLALSPDGTRLYVTAEIAEQSDERAPGSGDDRLGRTGCRQGDGPGTLNGLLYVFDTARALTPGQGDALVSKVAAGCSPVRAVVSADGAMVYVTARGDDRILQFDAAKLEKEPGQALVRALPSGGSSPVGMQLFAGDRKMLIANSNRFEKADGTVTVLDLTSGSIERIISAGRFPRNASISVDGRTLYVTNFESRSLICIPIE